MYMLEERQLEVKNMPSAVQVMRQLAIVFVDAEGENLCSQKPNGRNCRIFEGKQNHLTPRVYSAPREARVQCRKIHSRALNGVPWQRFVDKKAQAKNKVHSGGNKKGKESEKNKR